MGEPSATSDEQEIERKLKECVEQLTGGRVVSMDRQIRWRPSWFVDVDKEGETIGIYIRGDRQSDVLPFPELKREADILRVLEQHNIPVPHIYGMCEDPPAIIMEASPGTRDVSTAGSEDQQRTVARQYIEIIAAMHQLPLEPFVEIGIHVPGTAEEIALVGLDAYMPLYQRHKSRPEPFLEFALHWLQNNIPAHRTRPSFIAFDAGQFLFEDGKITALYDFEFAMIGDALTDLATMAMRQSVEPMGDDIGALCHYYAELTGEPLDIKVLRYHHALFSTVACMQFAGAVSNPKPGEPNDVYTEWDLALRRSLLNVLAENLGVTLTRPDPIPPMVGNSAPLFTMLEDAVQRIKVDDDAQRANRQSALNLVEYLARVDAYGNEINRLAAEEAQPMLGKCYRDPTELQAKLEAFVQSAGPEYDAQLLQFFANEIERKVMLYGDTAIGGSAAHVRLEAI
jgi:aminoglycoside phosphotransferase (APT) family kinase protein